MKFLEYIFFPLKIYTLGGGKGAFMIDLGL